MTEQIDQFLNWIKQQMESRDWGNNQFARKAKLPYSSVSDILNRQMNVNYKFCMGVARAFDLPPESVLRMAGLLPSKSEGIEDMTFREMLALMRAMTPKQRRDLLAYARFRVSQSREEQSQNNEG